MWNIFSPIILLFSEIVSLFIYFFFFACLFVFFFSFLFELIFYLFTNSFLKSSSQILEPINHYKRQTADWSQTRIKH